MWWVGGQHLSYIETLNLKLACSPKTIAWDTAVTGGWYWSVAEDEWRLLDLARRISFSICLMGINRDLPAH